MDVARRPLSVAWRRVGVATGRGLKAGAACPPSAPRALWVAALAAATALLAVPALLVLALLAVLELALILVVAAVVAMAVEVVEAAVAVAAAAGEAKRRRSIYVRVSK